MKLILGFAGEIASGKGTVAEYLVKNHSAVSYRFSTMLRDILDRLHIEYSRDHFNRLSGALRQAFGEDTLAKAMFEDTRLDNHEIIVVDGIRRPEDITFLKNSPDFRFIYIESDIKTRYERITKRNENSDDVQKTFAEFEADHLKETELQIKDSKEYANYVINNDGSPEEMFAQVDEIIRAEKKSHA